MRHDAAMRRTGRRIGNAGALLGAPVVVLAWTLAAVLAGGVAWWGVAAIGDDAGATQGGVLSESDVRAELAAQRAAATAGPAGPTPTSVPQTPEPTQTPTPEPTASASPEPSATTSDPPVTPPADQEVVRTWDVAGGQVAAGCRGSTISLLYATPLDGWAVEIKDTGPEQVEVELDRDESELTVRAVCTDGVPTMRTESDEQTQEDDSESEDD